MIVAVLVVALSGCTVPVTLFRYNEDHECWRKVTRELDWAYWSTYSDNAIGGCFDMTGTFADVDGHCWTVPAMCTEYLPEDPWVSTDSAENARCRALESAEPCEW